MMASSTNNDQDEVIIIRAPPLFKQMGSALESNALVEYPFYLRQPTEKMNRLFHKYKEIFKNALGDSLVSVNQMGSGAIPGMPGNLAIDVVVAIKNYPPTEEQLQALHLVNIEKNGDGKSPHAADDTWMHNFDFPPGGDFEEFKVDGKFPHAGHVGTIVVHLLHYTNPFVVKALAYVEYLKANKDAFKRYRDVKIQGARMSANGSNNDENAFIKYKKHKFLIVKELMDEALTWKETNGIKFPEELVQLK